MELWQDIRIKSKIESDELILSMSKKHLGIYLEKEFFERFKKFCDREHRTMSGEVKYLIEKEMQEKSEQTTKSINKA